MKRAWLEATTAARGQWQQRQRHGCANGEEEGVGGSSKAEEAAGKQRQWGRRAGSDPRWVAVTVGGCEKEVAAVGCSGCSGRWQGWPVVMKRRGGTTVVGGGRSSRGRGRRLWRQCEERPAVVGAGATLAEVDGVAAEAALVDGKSRRDGAAAEAATDEGGEMGQQQKCQRQMREEKGKTAQRAWRRLAWGRTATTGGRKLRLRWRWLTAGVGEEGAAAKAALADSRGGGDLRGEGQRRPVGTQRKEEMADG
ncbi:hypothetical protein B296_00057070 [Ensete ventricosum]|uniref:Uncharacterized protein n=1 Tax=Ensete ventricosum TaxID=4639 RepID=A0A426WX97_ENSVE|nr:hypothetical protein B296_00057070 [Ensete ventricosum]